MTTTYAGKVPKNAMWAVYLSTDGEVTFIYGDEGFKADMEWRGVTIPWQIENLLKEVPGHTRKRSTQLNDHSFVVFGEHGTPIPHPRLELIGTVHRSLGATPNPFHKMYYGPLMLICTGSHADGYSNGSAACRFRIGEDEDSPIWKELASYTSYNQFRI